MALNETKNKILAEDREWSNEIIAVEDNKTTMVEGYNSIYQDLFNRVKNVRNTFLGRKVIAGNGLEGGGDFTTDKTLRVKAKDTSIIIESGGVSVNKTDMLNVSNSQILASAKAVKEVNDKSDLHIGKRKNPHGVSKEHVGLENVMNYPSSDKYKILDGDGNKFSLQNSIKMMFDELKNELFNQSLIGEPILTLCDDLPNLEDFTWCGGKQLKKSDYPALWQRVENIVNMAKAKVDRGELVYGTSYFGWFVGDNNEYFRVPNINNTEHFLRPTNKSFSGRYEIDSFRSHIHEGYTNYDGIHNHEINIGEDTHEHKILRCSNKATLANWAGSAGRTIDGGSYGGYATTDVLTSTDTHSHSVKMENSTSHRHRLEIIETGDVETKPKNIAVKYYCRIK